MGKTTAVYARIDTSLKERAEAILSQLGITPTSAIQMLYSQVVLNNGLPFTPRVPTSRPTAVGALTRDEIDAQLALGLRSLETEGGISADDVEGILSKDL